VWVLNVFQHSLIALKKKFAPPSPCHFASLSGAFAKLYKIEQTTGAGVWKRGWSRPPPDEQLQTPPSAAFARLSCNLVACHWEMLSDNVNQEELEQQDTENRRRTGGNRTIYPPALVPMHYSGTL